MYRGETMPGTRATAGARISYRRESLRQSLSMRTVGFLVIINLVLVIMLGSLVMLGFERKVNPGIHTYGDALWVTVITVATVGYGDAVPTTTGGKLTVVIEILIGVSLLTAFFGIRSANKQRTAQRRATNMDTNVKVGGHYLVCGWNQRAPFVIERLKAELEPSRTPVVILCDQEVNPCDDDYPFFIRGNAVSERDLKRANVEKAEAAVLLADESKSGDSSDQDARTVLAALTIRSMNAAIKMTAEILQPENTHHLQLAGVGEIYDANMLSGNLLAQSAVHYGTIGMVTQLVTRKPSTRIFRLPVSGKMVGMSTDELAGYLDSEMGASLLAVSHEGRMTLPPDDIRFAEGDMLAVIAENEPPGAT